MNHRVIELSFYLALMVGVATLMFFIMKPYLTALFVALVLAIIFRPLYKWLVKKLRGRKGISATISLFVILVAILIPLSILGMLLFQEAKDFSVNVAENGGVVQYVDAKFTSLEGYINRVAPDIEVELSAQSYFEGMTGWITDNFDSVFTGVAHGTLNFFLMIIALWFFLRDGTRLKEVVIKWSPLADTSDEGILNKMTVAVESVIKGALMIAVIQGFLAGLGFAVFGIPSPVLWGFVATMTAFIPSLGTGIVVIPLVIFLFIQDATIAALGLLLWGVFVVGLVDNVLRPILIERGVKIHPFLILLSVFGGLSFFGVIGFLAGPIILAFVFSLIEIYPEVMKKSVCDPPEEQEV